MTGDADEDLSDDEISIGEASEDASESDSDDDADEGENDDENLQQADADVANELDPLGGDDGNEEPEPTVDARTARRQRRSRMVDGEEPTMPEEAQHPDESDERATNDTDDVPPRRSTRVKKKRLNDPYEYDRSSGAVFIQMVVENQDSSPGDVATRFWQRLSVDIQRAGHRAFVRRALKGNDLDGDGLQGLLCAGAFLVEPGGL